MQLKMDNLLTNIILNNFLESFTSNGSTINKIICRRVRKRRNIRNLVLQLHENQKVRKIPKVIFYFETIQEYQDDIFYSHFRMTKNTFDVSYIYSKQTIRIYIYAHICFLK